MTSPSVNATRNVTLVMPAAIARINKSEECLVIRPRCRHKTGTTSKPAAKYMTKELQTADIPACSSKRMGYQIRPHILAENNKHRTAKLLRVNLNDFSKALITGY